MPTLIGVFFLFSGLYCFFCRRDWLFGLTIFSAFFQAASILNIGSRGVQPYYLIALLYIGSHLNALFVGPRTRFSGKFLLLGFAAIGALSALVLPIVFAGTPVYSPGLTLDEGFFFRTPLQLSATNLVQAGCLLVNVSVVFTAASAKRVAATATFYKASFALMIALILVQFAASFAGRAIPMGMVRNNPSYGIYSDSNAGGRVYGTYTEPSEAGIALLILFGGSAYSYLVSRKSPAPLFIAALSIGLVRSSSALAASALVVALVIVCHPPFRSLVQIDWNRLLRIGAMAAAAAALLLSPLAGVLAQYTTQKSDTLSYVFRLAADRYALDLVMRTHGLGVGLGSNRPSSLATSLLSCVGVLGATVFLLMVWRLSQNARGSDTWVRWAICAYLIGKAFGGPDINEPQLWTSLALAASCSAAWKHSPVAPARRSWLRWFVTPLSKSGTGSGIPLTPPAC